MSGDVKADVAPERTLCTMSYTGTPRIPREYHDLRLSSEPCSNQSNLPDVLATTDNCRPYFMPGCSVDIADLYVLGRL